MFTKRLWVFGYENLTDELFTFAAANGYELIFIIPGRWMQYHYTDIDITAEIAPPDGYVYNGGYFNLTRDFLHRCRDEGIPCWLEIESDMNNRDGAGAEHYNVSTSYATYESDLGAAMTLFDTEGSYFVGFITELTGDNGILWLSHRARAVGKKVIQNWGAALGTTYKPLNSTYAVPGKGMDWRMTLVDEILFYDYYYDMHEALLYKLQWIRNYNLGFPIGISFVLEEYDPVTNPYNYWVETAIEAAAGPDYYVPYTSQLILAKQWLSQDAFTAQGFDNVTPQLLSSYTTPLSTQNTVIDSMWYLQMKEDRQINITNMAYPT